MFNSTIIEYEYCGDKFPHVDKTIYDRVGLATVIMKINILFAIFNKNSHILILRHLHYNYFNAN